MSRRGNGLRNSRNRFMLLAHNSGLLWQLEFCLSIFAVSCFSLSEDSPEFRYVPLYIADHVEFRCSFYKTISHVKKIITAFPQHRKKLVGYVWI